MKNNNVIAYLLIGVGALALLARTSGDAGWFWVGLVAAAFLAAYASRKSYGMLVPGCILTGIAVGLMLEGAWGWDGAFLISLGMGFVAIDRVEPRKSRWSVLVGGILAVLGLLIGLAESGALGSIWLALLLIGGGVYMVRRKQGKGSTAGAKGWVEVDGGNLQAHQTNPKQAAPASEPDTLSAKEAGVAPESADDTMTEPQPAVNAEVVADLPETVSIEPEDSVNMEAAPSVKTTEVTLEDKPDMDEALYAQLTEWRRETAKTEDRAAYLILTNASLEQIATDKPQTLKGLKNIKGIGPVKLERYGEAILALINV